LPGHRTMRVKTINKNQQKLSHVSVSKEQIVEVTHSIQMLRTRLNRVPESEHNKPLGFPLCNVGYSVRCNERLKQHASYNSSNYIMNLAEAICNACRDQFSQRHRVEQAVIYLIWSPGHAEIAEIGW
jgi:hypothetical protein